MKQKQALSTVLSVNPYTQEYYSGTSTAIEMIKKPKFQKTQYVLSFLKTKAFLSTRIEISKNIDEEDISDVIENKTYEELGLDIATEYIISSYELEYEQDETNRVFHVFVVDPEELNTTFSPIREQVKYIDQIYPLPLLIRSLYKKEIIRDSGVDCFIYFSQDDAFLTLYQEGEFIYTKELKFTLPEIHEHFCEIYGERVEYSNFMKLFLEEGLRTTNEENKTFLIKLFNELFTQINDVINFAKRAFELEEVNTLYIGTSQGVIFGMDEFAQTTLGIETKNFDFEYGFETNEFYVDQIQQLLHLTAQLSSEERYSTNFTRFERPPPFIQRESGRLILLAASAIVITSLYPLYNLGFTFYANMKNDSLQKEQIKTHKEKILREQQVMLQIQKRDELNKKIESALKMQGKQKNVLTQIHRQKVQYPMKGKIIADLTKDLNKYHVNLSAIKFNDDEKSNQQTFTLEMISFTEKRMTTMIEKLTHADIKHYKISLESITYDEDSSMYTSSLKVELR